MSDKEVITLQAVSLSLLRFLRRLRNLSPPLLVSINEITNLNYTAIVSGLIMTNRRPCRGSRSPETREPKEFGAVRDPACDGTASSGRRSPRRNDNDMPRGNLNKKRKKVFTTCGKETNEKRARNSPRLLFLCCAGSVRWAKVSTTYSNPHRMTSSRFFLRVYMAFSVLSVQRKNERASCRAGPTPVSLGLVMPFAKELQGKVVCMLSLFGCKR